MKFSETLLEYDSVPLTLDRRAKIASHIVGIGVMQNAGEYMLRYGESGSVDFINPHACRYMRVLANNNFSEARRYIHDSEIDQNRYDALNQIGIASEIKTDQFGNRFFLPNPDHIVATHYCEKDDAKQKIETELGLSEFLVESGGDQMIAMYSDRIITNIDSYGVGSNIRELAFHAIRDSEFWFDEPM